MAAGHFERLESYLPISLLNPQALILAFFVILFFVVFRYFLLVLPFYAVFYAWGPNWARKRQIYDRLPKRSEQLFELKWSLWTSLIFAGAGLVIGVFWEVGWTQLYLRFDEYGWLYLFCSWPILLVLHDTYFYWTHRWLHRPGVYQRYHSIHHRSLRPSPWASFSFHPVESLINAAFLPLVILVLPLQPVVVLFHLTFMTLTAITNHLGFEILPLSSLRWPGGQYLISGVHHSQHHRYFRYNYGLFFGLWDRWMGTEHPNFEAEFREVFIKSPKTRG